ncbi:MAG: hypothetical protein ACTH30_15155 [Leucobacter sp.]
MDEVEEVETPAVVSYPIPEGCPDADEFASSFMDDPSAAQALDASLLDAELEVPLPEGGCAYALHEPKQAESSEAMFWRVLVVYFRLDEPGRPSLQSFEDWGRAAGGAPATFKDSSTGEETVETSRHDLDLPDSFSGWTGSSVRWADGDGVNFVYQDDNSIPEFTQGASAKIDFGLNAEKVEAMLAQGDGTGEQAALAPHQKMSSGLATSFAMEFPIADEQGYTASVSLSGKVQPFTSDITNSPPGEFAAVAEGDFDGTVTNTTEGRRAQTPTVNVWLVYPAESSPCGENNWVSRYQSNDRAHCAIALGSISSGTAEPDGLISRDRSGVSLHIQGLEENSDDLLQANSPVGAYAVVENKRSVGPNGTWRPESGCLVDYRSGIATILTEWAVPLPGWPNPLCE